jgi:hypothetical protein
MLLLERLIDGLTYLGATFVRMDAAATEFDQRVPSPSGSRFERRRRGPG